jgi:hypothetical protein
MKNINDIETLLSKLRPAPQDELAEKILDVPRRIRQRRRDSLVALGGALFGTAATFLLMTVLSAPNVEIREVIREVLVEVPQKKTEVDVEYVPVKYTDVKPLDLDEMLAKQEEMAKRSRMFVNAPIYPRRFRWDDPITELPTAEYRNLLREMTQ